MIPFEPRHASRIQALNGGDVLRGDLIKVLECVESFYALNYFDDFISIFKFFGDFNAKKIMLKDIIKEAGNRTLRVKVKDYEIKWWVDHGFRIINNNILERKPS